MKPFKKSLRIYQFARLIHGFIVIHVQKRLIEIKFQQRHL